SRRRPRSCAPVDQDRHGGAAEDLEGDGRNQRAEGGSMPVEGGSTRVMVGFRVVTALPLSPPPPYTPLCRTSGTRDHCPAHDPNLVFWAFSRIAGSRSARPAVD